MEDNKTKEEILDQEATEACLTPTQRQLVLSAMEAHTQQSTKHLQDELNDLKGNIITRNEREWVLNSRIAQLEDGVRDAIAQIDYLHNKFKSTGSGNAVLVRLNSLLNTKS